MANLLLDKKAKRRLLKIDTEEVSLVGTPANEEKFLIAKSMEADMPKENKTGAADEGTEAIEVTQTTKGSPDATAQALSAVNDIVAKFENLAKALAPSKPEKAEDAEDASTEKALSPMQAFKAAGLPEDMAQKACAALKKLGNPFPPVKKDADESTENTGAQPTEDVKKAVAAAAADLQNALLSELGEGLQKSARFTPARVAKLQEAYETLKLLMESIAPNASPKTKVPVNPPVPGTGIAKSADESEDKAILKALEGVTKGLEALATQVTNINGRLDTVEKARPASQSEGNDATESATQKSANIWAGSAVQLS